MTISEEEFRRGRKTAFTTHDVESFLSSHSHEAFTLEEILRNLPQSGAGISLMTDVSIGMDLREMLEKLEERQVVGRKMVGLETYYKWVTSDDDLSYPNTIRVST